MATHAHEQAPHHGHGEHNPIGHVASKPMLLTVFFALVALTALTVWQGTQLELGSWELVIVLAIATLKALLVALYFMHLKYDKPLNAVAFGFSLLFVALFLGLTMTDTLSYQPNAQSQRTGTQ